MLATAGVKTMGRSQYSSFCGYICTILNDNFCTTTATTPIIIIIIISSFTYLPADLDSQ
jgi:hypothetical protein